MKAIQTEYRGYRFRSRLEARWAVFFDACGVEWEYEPEGYDLGGTYYLPDFLLHGVAGRSGSELYVEVKGQMTEADAEKIRRFTEPRNIALLLVGGIPAGETMAEIGQCISRTAYEGFGGAAPDWPHPFNFETVDGDYFAAYPGVNRNGDFELFGDDSSYLCEMDEAKTERAYRLARQARFEHGETPRRVRG